MTGLPAKRAGTERMTTRLVPRPSPATAEQILRRVFGSLTVPFAFRLWDGREVRFGRGEPASTAVIKSPEIFAALMRDPSPGHFAEAYVSEAIDLEGDLFQTMEVANVVEGIHLSAADRLRILVSMLKG